MIALLAAALLLNAKPPHVVVDGTALPASAVAEIGGRTFVALRAAADALNADVEYDSRAKTATFTTVVRQVVLKAGDKSIVVNGVRSRLDVAPAFVQNRLLVPLRALAVGLGASVHADAKKHSVAITSQAEDASQAAASSTRGAAPVQTLQGTVTQVESANGAMAVDISVRGQPYRVALPSDAVIQFRETRGNISGAGKIVQVRAGDTLIVSYDASGRVDSVADIFTGYLGTIAAISGSSMVLASGRVVNADGTATTVSRDGRPVAFGDLQASDSVAIRADPMTGEVRDIVAASNVSSQGRSAGSASTGSLTISNTEDNAASPFRAGQTLRVTAFGSAGAAATFDIGDMIVGVPMNESRPGRYEGSFDVGVGTNLVAAPVVVRLVQGASSVQAVTPDTATIITTPPSVREVAPSPGALVNSRRPSVYVTFYTLGDRGMLAESERLMVNGVDVTAISTRNSSYIYYMPPSDLDPGSVRIQVQATDTAGNALSYAWSFELAGS